MSNLKMCMRRSAILAVLFALSVGLVVAANAGVNVSNKTSSDVGTNMTVKVSILGVNSTAADQRVEIANNGTSNARFTGWKLMNKENVTYTFPASFVLKPGAKVIVHSMTGKPNSTNMYNSSVLFNKTGDIAILKDATGKVVSKYSYSVAGPKTPKVITATAMPNVTAPKAIEYKANNTKTTTSNISTNTAKDITKITIVK